MDQLIDILRTERNKLINRQQFQSAIFLSDKILSLNNSTEVDVFILAKCLFRLKEYQRAVYLIKRRCLQEFDIACCCLVVKCYVCFFHSVLSSFVLNLFLFFSINVKNILKRWSLLNYF